MIEHTLADLPEPAPPTSLRAGIMARIERLDATAPAEPRPVPADVAWPRRLAWGGVLAGAGVGIGTRLYQVLGGEMTMDLLGPRVGGWMARLVALPSPWPATLLSVGLLLYVAGLLATLATAADRERGGG